MPYIAPEVITEAKRMDLLTIFAPMNRANLSVIVVTLTVPENTTV